MTSGALCTAHKALTKPVFVSADIAAIAADTLHIVVVVAFGKGSSFLPLIIYFDFSFIPTMSCIPRQLKTCGLKVFCILACDETLQFLWQVEN